MNSLPGRGDTGRRDVQVERNNGVRAGEGRAAMRRGSAVLRSTSPSRSHMGRTRPRRCASRSPAWPETGSARRGAGDDLSTSEVAVCCSQQIFAQLVEQPRVLDGDDGLVGEILDQLDLLVGERANFLAIDDDSRPASSSLSIGTPTIVRAPPVGESDQPRIAFR